MDSNEEAISPDSDIEWQEATSTNRKRKIGNQKTSPQVLKQSKIDDANRFSPLSSVEETLGEPIIVSKPPPIFIPQVRNVKTMLEEIGQMVPLSSLTYKALKDGHVKLNVKSVDEFRKVQSFLLSKKVQFQTFQVKQERAFRVVLKNIHHSTALDDIRDVFENLGHKVRGIINVKKAQTKEPLPMFFIDLEPNKNNKEVFNIRAINHCIVLIEEFKKTNSIVQCHRCQKYGHTKSYCNLSYNCVKCGENHPTAQCQKNKDEAPKCVNCGKAHTANYKGCEIYMNIKNKMSNKVSRFREARLPKVQQVPNLIIPQNSTANEPGSSSYADVVRGNRENDNRLDKIEQLLNKQIELTNSLLNMLTLVISKLCK